MLELWLMKHRGTVGTLGYSGPEPEGSRSLSPGPLANLAADDGGSKPAYGDVTTLSYC